MAREEPISPLELSQRLDKPLSNVSYHVRVLADCAAVTLVRHDAGARLDAALLLLRGRGPVGLEILEPRRPEVGSAGESPDS